MSAIPSSSALAFETKSSEMPKCCGHAVHQTDPNDTCFFSLRENLQESGLFTCFLPPNLSVGSEHSQTLAKSQLRPERGSVQISRRLRLTNLHLHIEMILRTTYSFNLRASHINEVSHAKLISGI